MDPAEDIRSMSQHLDLIEDVMGQPGAEDLSEMVAGLFSECNVLRERLQDAVPAVLERDQGGDAMFNQISAVLERSERIQEQWKARGPSGSPSGPSGSLGLAGSLGAGPPGPPGPPTQSVQSAQSAQSQSAPSGPSAPSAPFGFEERKSEKKKRKDPKDLKDGKEEDRRIEDRAEEFGFPSFPSSSWPEEAFPEAAAWGNFDAWGEDSQIGAQAAPAAGVSGASGAQGAQGESAQNAPGTGSASFAAFESPGFAWGSSQSARAASSAQLHIRCPHTDVEQVERDQKTFKELFVRAAARAAGVAQHRIRVNAIRAV
ncbi:unnamed protein product [Effrenium voratum]|uniref:Uncharacterized protein n=1 Tax=Effrenium voratum TaxID=2562239 RepID=A0AA36J1N6_9DINO|nr:unnamed protein product [Effrenium voratum]CAJ1459788.1 unnamed protein product [Effrenium voratum]